MGSKSNLTIVYVFLLIAMALAIVSATGVLKSVDRDMCGRRQTEVKVLVPKGDYVLGPVIFEGPCKASTIHFELQGSLKASTDHSKYKKDGWISFYRITGFKLSGVGVFDGQGASAWLKNSCSKRKNCDVLPVVRSSHVIIDSVACGPGHGISIGNLGRYPDEKDITNVMRLGFEETPLKLEKLERSL
ncbi:hypothetical protein GIB67_014135 [Kingdonia uniflora]|uniref:Uncharacterized protein n=1 Tax=Kingdonia uniflora TaxID=39325 RepID=A0A7J7N476_9MAGN|nr:hypothetical protein GIB67_014135 [Kingdonia uniflora]